MSTQEPAWRKRTRPCPFFSQGRCLFADSCNFLHDIKVRSVVHQPLLRTTQVKQPSKPFFDLPSVVVDSASPRSVSQSSSQNSPDSIKDSSRYSGLLSVLSDVIGPPPNTPIISEDAIQRSRSAAASSSADQSLVLQSDESEDTLVDPFVGRMDVVLPEVVGQLFAEFQPVPDGGELPNGDTTSYLVEDTTVNIEAGSEADKDYVDDDDGSAVVMPDRQSTFSSFTGVSLLASPRNNFFGDSSVANPIEDGAADLLSPVHLFAKLRPISIPSSGSRLKRGDSIDSGYADGDSWVGPLPFPCSPPRSFRSSMTFPSHSRGTSSFSFALEGRRISCDISALRPSSHRPIEVINEVESNGSSEDNEDVASAILAVYDTSPSEEPGESEIRDTFQVNVTEKAEEDDVPLEVPTIMRSPRRFFSDHLHPTWEHDLDSCNQPSFVSDDNLSFRTALSTQPSCESLSDVFKVSLTKQDSLLSSASACTTPNTSILSQYDDASEQPIVGSYESELSFSVATSNAPATHSQTDPAVSDVVTGADDPQALANAPSTQEPQSVDFQIDRRFLTSTVPDPFDTDGIPGFSPEKVDTPQERLFAALHPDSHFPKPSPSTEISYLSDDPGYDGPTASEVLEVASQTVVVRRCTSDSPCPDERSLEPSPSKKGSCGSILAKDAFGHPLRDVDGTDIGLPADAVPAREHTSRFEQHLPKSSLSTSSLPEPSFTALPGHPTEHATAEGDHDQSLVAENSLGSDGVTSTFETGCDSFTQRLSFPLPPPFLPDEFIEHSTIDGGINESVLSDAAVLDLKERELTIEEVQRIRSGSDLTEKERPSRVSSAASSDSDAGTKFTSRRSRAASDITLKGKSDTTMTPGHSRSPPLALEQLGPSDSVQELYDQYFDDGTSEHDLKLSSPPSKDTALLDVPTRAEEFSQDVRPQSSNLTPHAAREESYPCCDGKLGTSGTNSSRSETVLRPLLTGRASFLFPSPAELAPSANVVNVTASSLAPPSTRLQVREIGSTMVPLGFRRHKPQPRPTQSSRISSRPLSNVLPVSELREVLRIRTDIMREELPSGCSSATQASCTSLSPLPAQSMSAPPSTGLKQLRLSTIVNKRSSILSAHSSSIASSILSSDRISNSPTPQSPSVSSVTSFSHNSQLSSSCEHIPEQIHHTLKRSISRSPIPQATDDVFFASQRLSRRDSRSISAPVQQPKPWRLSHYRAGSRDFTPADSTRQFSRRASMLNLSYSVSEQLETDEGDSTTSHSIQSLRASDWTHDTSVHLAPVHAIATPKPTLLFAIASDDVNQVRQVLENGEAGPNDSVGPQSALAFTLTNDKLAHKQEIVKALLAYGANPSALRNPALNPPPRIEDNEPGVPPPETTPEGMDPATRYFVARADTAHTRRTSQLIYRSFFRPLTRVQYDVIGQDWALEQLFRILGMHSQKLAVAPIVVLLCGPSGHGKSLLARKFGSLLDVPIHTVNMTTLQSAHDIWQSYSMSPYEEPSSCTLAEFLIENEEKRCIVVLDEIEKVEDQKALWSLLMPWELGRCSLEAGKRHVDARNVIWLGTSNIGHELVFEYHDNRSEQDKRMTREEYLELTGLLRPRVSDCLGPSLVSRVTTVLPFVPFTLNEKKAIAAEAVYALASDAAKTLSPQEVESLVVKALPSYQPSEGARSLHRAISNILVDVI